MARLKDLYNETVAPALQKKYNYSSPMQLPKLSKVVINVACGDARDNSKIMDAVISDLGKITGQHAVVCLSKKSVANFKLREGMPIGAKVTLRGDRMYEFVDKFFNVALPRVRDFRGITATALTATATMPSASRNRSFSRRSSTIRSTPFAAWTSFS